ncbi:MAG: DNA/RNA non-specific endonuclease [Prevotella sp.]|nr:DNA/RNA non-specific endonuclease [Prevotella sp.]
MDKLKYILGIAVVALSLSACSSGDNNIDIDIIIPEEKENANNNENNSGNNENNKQEDKVDPNNQNTNSTAMNEVCGRLEFPRVKGGANNTIIVHKLENGEVNYCTEWDSYRHSQRWSCYQLYRSNLQKNVTRYYSDSNQYPFDPDLNRDLYLTRDYFKGSGYDHGHICPSADRLSTSTANYQTFYLTNMQPQINAFNAKVWANMETQVRNIAMKNGYSFCDTLYVCKGGTIDDESNIIKRVSGVLIVPKYFFMALLAVKDGQYHAMAFWIEHKANSDTQLAKYAISVNELERRTGIDFFCNLPDSREETIEGQSISNAYWGLN